MAITEAEEIDRCLVDFLEAAIFRGDIKDILRRLKNRSEHLFALPQF
jgi:hypothetical protein